MCKETRLYCTNETVLVVIFVFVLMCPERSEQGVMSMLWAFSFGLYTASSICACVTTRFISTTVFWILGYSSFRVPFVGWENFSGTTANSNIQLLWKLSLGLQIVIGLIKWLRVKKGRTMSGRMGGN